MTNYAVTVFVNVGEGNFFGYKPNAPMAMVDVFSIDAADPLAAANEAWVVGNKEGKDAAGKSYPYDVRSLSTGDMLTIRDSETGAMTIVSVDSFGFGEIPEPPNPIVDLVGSDATSRI